MEIKTIWEENKLFFSFVFGMVLILVINFFSPYVLNPVLIGEGIDKFKDAMDQEGVYIQVNSVSKYPSDLYMIDINYNQNGQEKQTYILMTGDSKIFFPVWTYLDEYVMGVEEDFDAPDEYNPDVWMYVQPQRDKEIVRYVLELQKEMNFTLNPGYIIKRFETQDISGDISKACYTTDEEDGYFYGLTFCSTKGKTEVFESAFQRALYEIYGYDAWKEYAFNWYNCNSDIEECRTSTISKLSFNIDELREVISYNNIPSYMDTESQLSDKNNFNISTPAVFYINGEEYKGKNVLGAICSGYQIMPEKCQ